MPLSWFVDTLEDKELQINFYLLKKKEENMIDDIEEAILIFEDITRNFSGNQKDILK